MVPIAFQHAPTPTRPSRKASAGEWEKYRPAARLARIPLRASQQIASLPLALDAEPNGSQRPLRLFVDGGYTNATVLKKLPSRTTSVGRIRKDAKLHFLPESPQAPPQRGRPRKNSKLLHRQPAFLICADPTLDLRSVVQGYVQRWVIAVNFREEKT